MAISTITQQQEIILLALKNAEKYGLEMVRFITEASGDRYCLPIGTLYPTLAILEKRGLVRSRHRDDEVAPGGRRRYYSLTDEGRKMVEAVEDFRRRLCQSET